MTLPFDDVMTAKQQLVEARQSLRHGDTRRVQRTGRRALEFAQRTGNAALEAEASLSLAKGLVLESKMNAAFALQSRAYHLYTQLDDDQGCAEALTGMSFTSTCLARVDDALRFASHALELQQEARSEEGMALALNYYGVACIWNRDLATARDLLEASVWYSNCAPGESSASFHPLLNLCLVEVFRILSGEVAGEQLGVERLVTLMGQARHASQCRPLSSFGGTTDLGWAIYQFCDCFVYCRLGQFEDARESFELVLRHLSALPADSWMHTLGAWARMEIAKGLGDFRQVVVCAHTMAALAGKGEHIAFQQLGIEVESYFRGKLG